MERKLPPLVLLVLIAALMAVITRLTGGRWWPASGLDLIALVPLSLGIGLALAGVIAFRRAGTTVDPRDPGRSAVLVRSGIYAHTRNPMYLGFLLALLAWAMWLANPPSLGGCLLLVWYLNRYQIEPEERALLARFGDDFRRYCDAVPRWW